MAFRTIVITKHSKINYKMNLIVVQTGSETKQVTVDDISTILIESPQAVITAFAVMEMLKRNIKIIFCDEKHFPVGEVNGYFGNKMRNTNIDTQISWKQKRKDALWQSIMTTKLSNQCQVLKANDLDYKKFENVIDDVEIGDKTNREAIAARMYFPRIFGKEFARKDEDHSMNASLNYGYQILLSAVARQIHSFGYLTEIGIHHDNKSNAFNLASDLMEPFRPVI